MKVVINDSTYLGDASSGFILDLLHLINTVQVKLKDESGDENLLLEY